MACWAFLYTNLYIYSLHSICIYLYIACKLNGDAMNINSLPLHQFTPKNPEVLQQLYGVINGVFLVCAALVLLSGISHYRSSFFKLRNNRMSATFSYFLVFIGFASFGLYNVFYQGFSRAVTINTLPDWLFYISRFSSPIALASITFIFLLVTEVKSYTAFRFQEKHKVFIRSLYLMDLLALVVLLFMDDMNNIALLNGSIFVPHCAAAVLYCLFGLKDVPYSALMAAMFALMAVVFAELNRQLFYGTLSFTPEAIALTHTTFTITHTIFTFITLRFGYDEMLRFLKVKDRDNQHLIHGFGNALKNNEFFLTYQPQINLKTNEFSGLETLIRWQHPRYGHIPPIEFIELAEVSGKIDDLCCWVISQSLKEVTSMRDHLKSDLRLSINFSAKNLNATVLEHLQRKLEYYNFPAKDLTVEITETVVIEETSETRHFLNTVYDMGVELSIDDYGTGFSSLSYLNKLQLSELKLDRSFVSDIDENHENFVISHSTITMSKSLNYKVVAEGVETAEAMEILKTINCDYAQGFFIARPMTESELCEWVKRSSYQLAVSV